jgi:hypothetical protein
MQQPSDVKRQSNSSKNKIFKSSAIATYLTRKSSYNPIKLMVSVTAKW